MLNKGLSHKVWAAAQLAPGESISDGLNRIDAILRERYVEKPVVKRRSSKIEKLIINYDACLEDI